MLIGNFVASVALVMLLRDVIPKQTLLLWLGCLYILNSAVLVFYFYLRPFFTTISTIPDKKFYYYLPLYYGIMWGMTGIIFFTPESITHIAFLIIFLFGMTSAGLNPLSASWLSFALFAIPALLPLAIQLILHNKDADVFIWLAITILTYLIALLVFSQTFFKSITQSLEIRYENLELVKKLRTQTEAAEKANRDKSSFLAAASHDLRQPIHSLSLFTSAITKEVHTDRGKALLTNIDNANQVMLDLLNSLLDISKLDAGVITPTFQQLEISTLIKTIADEYLPLANKNDLQLRWRSTQGIVKTDPVLLSNILRNLLQNAIRYTKSGKILFSCRKRKETVLIQVWDTGQGIEDKNHQLIFNEFQQLDNPERDQNKGLGLGLAICQRLSLLLDHSLTLKSKVGKGSVFSIELPLVDEKNIDDKQSGKYYQKTHKTIDFNKAVILVIDDNSIVLEATKQLLEGWGTTVLQADSVESAQQQATSYPNKVDIIIADYRLRNNTTGIQAIDAFNEMSAYPAAGLLLTGDTEADRLREASSHGLPLLHKPIKEAHLKNALSKILRM